jgi:hypothetical protein
MAAREPLLFQSVEFSEGGICERGANNLLLVCVRRETIEDLRVEHGMLAERAYLQSIVGGMLVAGGVLLGAQMISNALLGRFMVAPGVFVVTGGWILQGVVTRGTYVRVQTRDAIRKLIFKGKVAPDELARFLAEVRAEFGYEVSMGDLRKE